MARRGGISGGFSRKAHSRSFIPRTESAAVTAMGTGEQARCETRAHRIELTEVFDHSSLPRHVRRDDERPNENYGLLAVLRNHIAKHHTVSVLRLQPRGQVSVSSVAGARDKGRVCGHLRRT